MKINKEIVTLFAITLCFTSWGMSRKAQRKIRRSAERIMHDPRLSNSIHTEQMLIESLSEQETDQGQTQYPDDLSNIVDALNRKRTLSIVRQNAETLHKAHQLFYLVPGYKTLLKRILTSSDTAHAQGALYEVEVALDIEAQDDGETVIEFGRKISSTYHPISTEIDIVTKKTYEENQEEYETETWIECKNTTERAKKLAPLKTQLKRQSDHATAYGSDYKVYFKSTISPKLTNWLRKQRISYISQS